MSLHSPKESAPHRPQGILSQAAAFVKTAQGRVLAGVGALGLVLAPETMNSTVQAQQPVPMTRAAEWNPNAPENKEKVRASKKDLQLVLQVQYKKEWDAFQNARNRNKPDNVSEERWTEMKQNEGEMRRRLAEASRNLCKALNQYVTTTPNIGEAAHIAAAEVIATLGADDPELRLLSLEMELKVVPQNQAETDKRVRAIADAWNGTEPKLNEATALRFALAYNRKADEHYAAGNMSAAYETSTKANSFLPQDNTPSKELEFMRKVLKRTSTLIAIRMEKSAKQVQLAEAQTAFAKDPLNKAAAKIVYEDHVANKRYEAAMRILCALQFFGADVTADVPTEPAAQIDGAVKWEERLKDPKYQKDPVIRLLMYDAVGRHYQAVLTNPNASAVLKGLAEKKLGQSAVPVAPVTPPKVTETKPVPARPGTKETDPTKEPKRPNYVPKEAVWLAETKSWYLLIPRVMDLAEAEKMAAMTKGHLVTANNAAEYALIQKMAAGKPVFLGVRLNEGKWVNADGKADQYFDWQPGEPSNGRGETGVQILGNGKANDIHPLDPSCNSNVLLEWEAPLLEIVETTDVIRGIKQSKEKPYTSGKWTSTQRGLMVEAGFCSRIQIPISIDNKSNYDYELEVEALVIETKLQPEIGFCLPLGEKGVTLFINGWNDMPSGGRTGLSDIEGISAAEHPNSSKGVTLPVGKNKIVIFFSQREGNGNCKLMLNDKLIYEWSGKTNTLSYEKNWQIPSTNTLAIGAGQTTVEFTKIDLKRKKEISQKK